MELDQRHAGKAGVLYVDDEVLNLDLFRLEFEDFYNVLTAKDGQEALAAIAANRVDVILTDERMPGLRGVDLLARVHELRPEISRVIVSAYGDAERLMLAMNRGHAHEYVFKPWKRETLQECIERCVELSERWNALAQQARIGAVLAADEKARRPAGLVGSTAALAAVVSIAERAAQSSASIVITGETGTGKEVVASLIHDRSPRSKAPFVRVNCGALSEGVLESELFGHEQGSFSGASRTHKGRFEIADGGTLFLDEIGDVSPRMQTTLLRVLQEHCFERVGGTKSIAVDVRIIAATHRDLAAEVASGRFRQDLFYRLNVIPIHVPALRERSADIPELIMHFIAKHGDKGRVRSVAPEAIEALLAYEWPGNVRELENAVQRALILGLDDQLAAEDFSLSFFAPTRTPESPRDEARSAEARMLHEAIVKSGGNLARAARSLGIPRTTLASRAAKFGLI